MPGPREKFALITTQPYLDLKVKFVSHMKRHTINLLTCDRFIVDGFMIEKLRLLENFDPLFSDDEQQNFCM